MFEADRHEPLVGGGWRETQARAAIREIAGSALSHFDRDKLWPAHPLDGVPDGFANLYFGAAGVMLALDHLKRAGAIDDAGDFRSSLPSIVERDQTWLSRTPFAQHGSLLMGDLGTRLAAMRLQPDSETANRVHERASANTQLPLLDLMWGTAGSLTACTLMAELTQQKRFEELFRVQAVRLLAAVENASACKLWTLEMQGRRLRYLGLVHGFAGNLLPLIQGWRWLSAAQQRTVSEIAIRMLEATATRDQSHANWPADADHPEAPMLCQICRGAPGIVAAFAGAPFLSPECEQLLLAGGELIWKAGPLKKGSNFCHGTGGNAYALLKLYQRTHERKWLDRARAFGMRAIAQMRAARDEHGRGRYTLWTGDAGLAVCLWSCITGEPKFPGLDAI